MQYLHETPDLGLFFSSLKLVEYGNAKQARCLVPTVPPQGGVSSYEISCYAKMQGTRKNHKVIKEIGYRSMSATSSKII